MIRHVPLLRRTPLRAKPQRDRVTASERDYVLRRDGSCLMAQFNPRHVCRDAWGVPHAPWVVPLLTVEHVHDGYGMAAKRAPSDPAHLVALCHGANVGVPSKEARAFFRDYLAGVSR